MKVGAICSKLVVTTKRSDEVSTAARLMRDKHVGYLVVVDSDAAENPMQPIGVLTDRDLVVTLLARDVTPKAVLVGDLMTGNPVTVSESDTIATALKKMRDFGVRRLPVVNERGTDLVGVLSTDDVLKVIAGDAQDLVSTVAHERSVEGLRRA